MRDHLLLYVNGERHEVRGAQVFQPLSDFLRYQQALTGTKVVCAEGDCGSCTVLIGRPRGGKIQYQTVTSCIQYLAQLDATHIVTVEGLRYDSQLNPVQEAMVEHHGAQCGFCTPGFVVSMCAVLEENREATPHDVTRGLVGNLCRCTGYQSILQAAAHTDRNRLRTLGQLYPDSQMAQELTRRAAESVTLQHGPHKLCKPATLEEAVRFRAQEPDCTILSGGTDLGVQWNKGRREVRTILATGAIEELRSLKAADNVLTAGAGITISELEKITLDCLPEFGRMLARFGSPPIKNAGTLGGNIANGSPIGDSMPALFVLDAEIELIGPQGRRRVNINEFYTGYRQSVMQADELIARVIVPLPAAGELFKVYKISKREDLDISSFTAAIWMRTEGNVVREARIAYGGVGPTILRLPKTEAWLSERPLTEATLREAGPMARSEISPISDVRGSAAYRELLAENILVKFGREMLAGSVACGNGG